MLPCPATAPFRPPRLDRGRFQDVNMDDKALQSLLTALAVTPDNGALRDLVLKTLEERGEASRAYEVLAGYDAAKFAGDERLLAARICLAAGKAQEALALATLEDTGSGEAA